MTLSFDITDRLMDAAILPGFTALGYRVRSRVWKPTPDLSGRQIVVTGASSGLGAATSEILA
jgi:dehydrogenase/reductase SDR family member 12